MEVWIITCQETATTLGIVPSLDLAKDSINLTYPGNEVIFCKRNLNEWEAFCPDESRFNVRRWLVCDKAIDLGV